MYVIRQPEVVAAQIADFEKLWIEAEPLCERRLEEITEAYFARVRAQEEKDKEKEKSRSRSKSVPRDAPSHPQRSLGDASAPSLEVTQE